MKKALLIFMFLGLAMSAKGQVSACEKLSRINALLQTRHYKPKPLNDSLSAYVFNTLVDQLDENHILFTDTEYKQLSVHKYKIDDYIKSKQCTFLTDFINAYKKALERKKKMIEQISSESLTYFTKDTMYYARTAFAFVNDTERMKRYNRKKITYDILENIAEQSSNKDSLLKVLPKLFAETKVKIIDTYLCKINNQLNPSEGFDNALYDKLFSVFCSYFDPHSNYFNYNDRASFVSSISTQSYSLGLYIGTDSGDDITIEEVVPGGPAFKTNKIEKGDKLIKLSSNGKEYVVSCTSMDAISNMVVSDTYKDVDLTLRKKDGTVYTVKVTKEIMKDDQNLVYHYILGTGAKKTGYLKIPSFYTNYENPDGKGVAADVADAITAMLKENIKGLIIDLQFNGGGSMDEVIQLCGMFINYGPVTILTDKQLKYNTIRDYNRGMLYNGPMVVLVNGYSASASEFFAGVMQDYNRAVVVGTTTHGKASMQSILPLEENDDNNFVKVTVDRFYRVSGQSSQYSGIKPDIAIPTLFDILVQRESSMPNALLNDSIDVKLRYNKLPDTPLKYAVAASIERVKKESEFAGLQRLNDKINLFYNEERKKLPVTFNAVFNMVHSTDALYKEIKKATETEHDITVTGSYEPEGSPDFVKNINDHKIKTIKTDPYIYESINILRDLNSFKKQ